MDSIKSSRYQRHSLIDGFSQDQIGKSRFAVIGAGAVGNEVLKNLALLGVGEAHVFDIDIVEVHNLTRSVLFREGDIGRNKVECATERARDLDPAVRLFAYHGNAWDLLSIDFLRGMTAVFGCVDNFEIRLRLNQLCFLAGVDFINCGIDSRYAVAEVFPFSQDKFGGCYECTLPATAYRRMAERYSCGWLRRVAYFERKVPTTILTSSVAGALGVSFGTATMRGSPVLTSRRALFDTREGSATSSTFDRATGCGWCGRFSESMEVVPCRWDFKSGLFSGSDMGSIHLSLSDQIIVGGACKLCNREIDRKFAWQRADQFDDSLVTCEVCKEQSVDVRIRDQFTVSELEQLDRVLDVKFAIVNLEGRTLCLDFQGG